MARILVVDDETDITFLVKKILGSVGHEVISASSGEEALEILMDIRPDLILLDIMMPELDGWQTLELIREHEGLEDVPVAMLTVKSLTPEIAARKDIEELVDYIEKPFTRESLIQRVNYSIIEDLDLITRKKSLLSTAVDDNGTGTAYEIAARLERLHKSILATLKDGLDRIDEPLGATSIRDAIASQQQAIELFKNRREKIERISSDI